MKRSIILILVLVVFVDAKAQSINLGFPGAGLPDNDTLKVKMLCTDDTQYPKGSMLTYEQSLRVQGFSFKVDGYLVRRKQSDQYNESFWMEVTAYWDENKKPLSKNIIVWQIK